MPVSNRFGRVLRLDDGMFECCSLSSMRAESRTVAERYPCCLMLNIRALDRRGNR
jgi:hypothetical protein